MNIARKNTPNQSSRNGWRPDMIVCHITDGSYAGAVAWHCNPESGVSSHFIVSQKGEVTQLVPLDKMSWCNGTTTNGDRRDCKHSTNELVRQRKTNANYYTIAIECEGFSNQGKGALTEIQLKTLAELIQHIRAEIKKKYDVNIPIDRQHIVGHYEINPKSRPNCPGFGFQWDKLIELLKGCEPTKKLYRVQVGAYRVRANALAVQEALKNHAYVGVMVCDDGMYKVQVGAFSNKANAEALLSQLNEQGFACIIHEA